MTWKRSGSVERRTLTRRIGLSKFWKIQALSITDLILPRNSEAIRNRWFPVSLTRTFWRVMPNHLPWHLHIVSHPATHHWRYILRVMHTRILLIALAECPSIGYWSDKPKYIHPMEHHAATKTRGSSLYATTEKYPRWTVRWKEQGAGEIGFVTSSSCTLHTCRIHMFVYAQKISRRESKRLSTVGISGFRARKVRLVFFIFSMFCIIPMFFFSFLFYALWTFLLSEQKMSLILWGKEEKGKKGMCLNHSPCGGSFRVWRVPQGQCRHTQSSAPQGVLWLLDPLSES